MRIALLSSSKGSLDTFGALKFAGPRMPAMGILHLAGNMEKHGYKDINIYDADLMWKKSKNEILDWVCKIKPDILGITLYTNHAVPSQVLLAAIKKALPETIIIAGGPHCTVNKISVMSEFDVDYICIGEGEHTMVEFLDAISGKRGIETVKGLVYRHDGEVVYNGARELEPELDSFPYPAYHLIKDYIPQIRPQVLGYKRKPVAMVISERGCPYDCGFCSDSLIWTRENRSYSAEYLVDYIQHLQKEFGIKEITFFDDTFLLNNKRVAAICDLLIERNINISWSANINIAHVKDEELVKKMKAAGCWYVSTGIESGNDEILKFIKKPQTLKKIRDGVHMLDKYGISVRGYFVLGLLKETPESIEDTINLMLELPLYSAQVGIYSINEGSRWDGMNEQFGTVHQEFVGSYGGIGSDAETMSFIGHGLTAELLLRKRKEANMKFYFRPSQILKYFLDIRSMVEVKRMFLFLFAGGFYIVSGVPATLRKFFFQRRPSSQAEKAPQT